LERTSLPRKPTIPPNRTFSIKWLSEPHIRPTSTSLLESEGRDGLFGEMGLRRLLRPGTGRPFRSISRGETMRSTIAIVAVVVGAFSLAACSEPGPGPKGEQGPPGGHKGQKGEQGAPGPQGAKGEQGFRGRKVRRARRESKALQGRRARRESKALQGRRGLTVRKANKALLARPVRQHQPACMLSGRTSVMASATSSVTRARQSLL
jgi:hypothetical protein